VIVDDLTALLNSRKWVERRVDRVEFLDLMTVRRTIVLTLNLDAFTRSQAHRWYSRPSRHRLIPAGWFVPWANAGAVLVDAEQRVIPYLPSKESDHRIEQQIKSRWNALGLNEVLFQEVLDHRRDPGLPGHQCKCCIAAECDAGYRELMSNKWGCRAVLNLLAEMHQKKQSTGKEREMKELARILLAWQTNFVLFACLETSSVPGDLVTLQLSYDEELVEWEPPWERRKRVLLWPDSDLSGPDSREYRKHISRGSPFQLDLDKLRPSGLHGWLARRKGLWLRKLGRRGFLQVAWHVAWQQASGLDVPDHHVDVILPNELMVVRMRMLRMHHGNRYATVADQVGSHATIVAPEVCSQQEAKQVITGDQLCDGGRCSEEPCDAAPSLPTLFSLVITRRSPASWYGGAWIALLTGFGLLAVALRWLPEFVRHADAGIAVLVLAPTLVATVLSVRASSEIAEQLTGTLRRLIEAVGVLAAICAASLVVQPGPPELNLLQRLLGITPPTPDLAALKYVWIGIGAIALSLMVALLVGACRIRRLLAFGRRPGPRYVDNVLPGIVLNPPRAPKIPPPDRWLNVDEGELVPWAWLDGLPGLPDTRVDESFWQGYRRQELVDWVQKIFEYKAPQDASRCLSGPVSTACRTLNCRCHHVH
jgi:hypothetical protein